MFHNIDYANYMFRARAASSPLGTLAAFLDGRAILDRFG